MKPLLFFIGLITSCWQAPVWAQNSYLTIGPTIALDQYKVNVPPGAIGATIKNPATSSYGLALSYKFKRVLVDVKALTSKRTYKYSQTYPITRDPGITTYTTISAHYFLVPITISYLVYSRPSYSLFVGGGVLGEWLPGDYWFQSVNQDGTAKPIAGGSSENPDKFRSGGSAQAIFRYSLSNKFLLSIEPSYRFFPRIAVPVGYRESQSLSMLGSLNYKL